MKLTFDQLVEEYTEDSGCAHILEFDSSEAIIARDEYEEGVFVRVQSWSLGRTHPEMQALQRAIDAGKQVRVTVEIIDDDE